MQLDDRQGAKMLSTFFIFFLCVSDERRRFRFVQSGKQQFFQKHQRDNDVNFHVTAVVMSSNAFQHFMQVQPLRQARPDSSYPQFHQFS